jgi:hypothetical protein
MNEAGTVLNSTQRMLRGFSEKTALFFLKQGDPARFLLSLSLSLKFDPSPLFYRAGRGRDVLRFLSPILFCGTAPQYRTVLSRYGITSAPAEASGRAGNAVCISADNHVPVRGFLQASSYNKEQALRTEGGAHDVNPGAFLGC